MTARRKLLSAETMSLAIGAPARRGALASGAGVRAVNLGPRLNIRDPEVTIDGVRPCAPANRVIAANLVEPVLEPTK